ncbi:GyrI-like domain-containing protein [Hahella ganghwensis]|uniref:GyrI-like domain-containing protein n=1 Tax=Hahella ganghwensis TaxID=286420 RepID=UPI0012FCF6BD|nr:GyrI-like domain-containing protein [Hahella ganghwensis]
MLKHKIIERPAFTIVGMVYHSRDENDSIPALWGRYLPRECEIDDVVERGVSYGLCLPAEEGDFRYVAGVEVKPGSSIPEGMVSVDIAAHRYVVVTHTGPVMEIANTFRVVNTQVLPDNGLEHDGKVDFERYDHRFRGPDNPQSEVDIYISLA